MSVITVSCPTCSLWFRANSSYQGQQVRCPNCMNVVTVPAHLENLQNDQTVDSQGDKQDPSTPPSARLPKHRRSRRTVESLLPPRATDEAPPSDSVRLPDRPEPGDLFPAQQPTNERELVVSSTRETDNRIRREFQPRSRQPAKNPRFWKNLIMWLICTLILLVTTFVLAKLSV